MSGINYDLRKIKGMAFDIDGVLSPSTIPMDAEGMPLRMVNIKDGYAIQLAVKCGFKLAIITGGNSQANLVRYSALGVQDIFQGIAQKLPCLHQWMADNSLTAEEVLYMGDDIPDLPVLREVGLSCAPFDSAAEVLQTVKYVSRFTGGYGCVRDVIEQILKCNDMWLADSKAFGW
ncbi:MAG: 3-deoxy-D-manno-octulosonate 8-phosphate phosphatase [Prevotella sp.]|nr:3-deoxy-D-manno-octulosonate 8-phosphate phosphatase [Bacteroides sp.]MCM1366630.1 3-deoxy-D-manno-octulosonate 8-phosphate phosphatase [Prevotella sp.]MCM1436995.1 3-deoxy-D-manno-octulosonate 8-phosphate phosphatase [Prevotella sp.]